MIDLVVDTDVVSYGFRRDQMYLPYSQHLAQSNPVVAFATYAELMSGAKQRGWGQNRTDALRRHVLNHYFVFDAPLDLCDIWADLVAEARSKGRVLNISDGWVAATAVYLNVPLASNNRRDYEYLDGLQLISYAPT